MNALRLLPVFIGFLLIAAHFHRAGYTVMVALCLLLPGLLLFTRPWSAHIVRIALFLASAEWLRTLISLVQLRIESGQSWARLAVILGIVAAGTAVSTLLFRLRALRDRYGL